LAPGPPRFAVDLFVQEPFDFDAVYKRALRVPLPGIQATVVSRDALVAMKRLTGRARDLEDIAALSELSEGEP
jgi:hypothetical protein